MVGQELIQFGHADPQGGGIWRLTRLLRGRLGTEDAMAATTAGDGFAMIDNDAALPLPRTVGLAALSIGGRVRIAAPGGAVPVELAIAAAGRSARPLSPVHLAASHGGDGRITLRWTIRSRAGFGWDDGSDALPDGAVTGHIVDVVAGSISARFETGATQLVIDAATVSAWRASAPTALVAVRQTAAGGESVAAETIITL